ncbi:MAG: type I-E CRISPR-associated protein Cas7/Cse4/CasC [Armatimonadetes bacterium]|nr:type I-E CRISPR-associated protein Cas7/Cse4/CasC [Armatimonadota bacterium]
MMNTKTVELHLIQSFPPSCINRDGNNSPKDCTFGNVRRARISSQCLKRAIRQADSFADIVGEEIASRSKLMRDKKLVPYLLEKGLNQADAEQAADAFRVELAKDDKKKDQTSVGLYFGDSELFALLDAHRTGDKNWRKAPRVSADVALFGRMLAEAPEMGVDAAAQVAHAISTHKLAQNMDYWTAADDLRHSKEGEDTGASMLGTAEFNASVFYRYALVSVSILQYNLRDQDLVGRTIEAFMVASSEAMPTGKITGHAHGNPPLFALAVVRRKGMPLNLCNAFLKPAEPTRDKGLGQVSSELLVQHLQEARKMLAVDEAQYFASQATPMDSMPYGLEYVGGYRDLVSRVMAAL